MRQLREILRLRLQADLSMRQIRDSLRVSLGSIQMVVSKANELALQWSVIDSLDDQALAQRFYPQADTHVSSQLQIPDWSTVHQELGHKEVSKQLLWEEYSQQFPNRCYSYSQFCFLFHQWLKKQRRSMRQIHLAGEKLFVDYAGQTVPIISSATGEIRTAQIFVAVLGASNYTFCEATWSQGLADWLGSHVNAFAFFGGVPEIVVPDNLKSGVTKACRYDPDVNRAYQQLAEHYRVAVVPARPYKPKDKSKAEVGVQIVERWILARLRHHSFFSLAEVNQCIKALLEDMNTRPFKQLKGNRRQRFESLDKPALKPLPKHPYQYTEFRTAKVNIDYHLQYDDHLYSVPHHLVGERVELQATTDLVQVLFHNRRVASHVRKYQPGMTTTPEHMPHAHAKHRQWTAQKLMNWAADLGPGVLQWVKYQLKNRRHEEQAYRVCLGLLNLTRQYPVVRLDKACTLANQRSLYRLKHIKAILRSHQDTLVTEPEKQLSLLPQSHENIRGPESFH